MTFERTAFKIQSWNPRKSPSSPLLSLRWDRCFAQTLLVVTLCVFVSINYSGMSLKRAMQIGYISCSSFETLWLLPLLSVFSGKRGFFVSLLTLSTLALFCVWYIASLMLYSEQGWILVWDQLIFCLKDPGYRPFILSQLFSLNLLIFIVVFGAMYRFFLYASRKISINFLVSVSVIFIAVMIISKQAEDMGRFLHLRDGGEKRLEYWQLLKRFSTPWSSINRIQADEAEYKFFFHEGRKARSETIAPAWAEGPEKILPDLLSQYQNRSVIFIQMESYRASDIEGLGEGALHHAPLSPRFTGLSKKGILFTNYMASGKSTLSSFWSLITGLPNPIGEKHPTFQAPEAATLGRLPDFSKQGYSIQGVRAAVSYNQNWDGILGAVGARYELDPEEVEGLSRKYWGPWGMPDDQLFSIALDRYKKTLKEDLPVFIWILTASNHNPYLFPESVEGVTLTKDYKGGMGYADFCMGRFVDELLSLPKEKQPIIFITSDTSHNKSLEAKTSQGQGIMELIRIPGLLILPDKRVAGEKFDGLFTHEDTFDFLYTLVAPEGNGKTEKFLKKHRVMASFDNESIFLSKNTYYDVLLDTVFGIEKRWTLVNDYGIEESVLMKKGAQRLLSESRTQWKPKGYKIDLLAPVEDAKVRFFSLKNKDEKKQQKNDR